MSALTQTTHVQLHASQAAAATSSEPTTSLAAKPRNLHQQQLVLLIQIVARMFRKAGALCGLLLFAKLLLGEPIFAYMLQFYSHRGNPMTLRLWKKFGSNL